MTIEQFNKTGFTGKMQVMYKGKIYDLASVDFEESLIGIAGEIENDSDEVTWKRCENCEII